MEMTRGVLVRVLVFPWVEGLVEAGLVDGLGDEECLRGSGESDEGWCFEVVARRARVGWRSLEGRGRRSVELKVEKCCRRVVAVVIVVVDVVVVDVVVVDVVIGVVVFTCHSGAN